MADSSPERPPSSRPGRLEAGILLVSFSVLFLELLLTRIFSVTMYYHLSFLVVSLAMLGLGASGLAVGAAPERFRRGALGEWLGMGAALLAATSAVVVGVACRVPVALETTAGNWLRVALVYALCLLPFAAGGLVVALALARRPEEAGRLYAFDLAGAALACLAFLPATARLGAPTAVLAGGAIAAAAGAVFAGRESPRTARLAAGLACVLALLAAANLRWGFYDVTVVKGREQEPTLAMRWNAFSRVEVLGSPEAMRTPRRPYSFGLSARLPADYRVPELYLEYDAAALTQMTGFAGDPAALAHLRYDVSSAPYQMRRFEKVLVLGAGCGRDVLTALHLGSGPVTAVEVNPITVELLRGPFREFTGGLYDGFPGVAVAVAEGRTFVHGSRQTWDLIQGSLVDTWAASAAGAHALSENGLYTVEAFEAYLRHLEPEGVLAVSRWFWHPPVEALRVVALAGEALGRLGVEDPAPHVFVVRTDERQTGRTSLGTVLVKRSPLTAEERLRLRIWAAEMGFLVPFDAGAPAGPEEGEGFAEVLGPGRAAFAASFPYDLSPATDDRPFFFDHVPLVPWLLARAGLGDPARGAAPLTLGGQTLLVALAVSTLATALFLLAPALRFGRRREVVAGSGRRALWALYFAGLGLGFIVVEVVLLQRFHLLLGAPAYALSVVLSTLLLAGGAGSYLSRRWPAARLAPVLAALAALLALAAALLPGAVHAALPAPLSARVALAVLVLAPLGLLMGMPFPLALRHAGREDAGLVPSAWAVNGAASVLGSVLTVVVAMTWGLTASLATGAVAYAAALGLAVTLGRGGGFRR